MNYFEKTKIKYEQTEIPSELAQKVQEAIESGGKRSGVKIHVMRLLPVAVCAVICLAIGINYLGDIPDKAEPSVAEETAGLARAFIPEAEKESAVYKEFVADSSAPTAEANAKNSPAALGTSGEVLIIYSDENIISYSVTDDSGKKIYYNKMQKDGSEIEIESLIENFVFEDETGYFYFNSAKSIVVGEFGKEREISLD